MPIVRDGRGAIRICVCRCDDTTARNSGARMQVAFGGVTAAGGLRGLNMLTWREIDEAPEGAPAFELLAKQPRLRVKTKGPGAFVGNVRYCIIPIARCGCSSGSTQLSRA